MHDAILEDLGLRAPRLHGAGPGHGPLAAAAAGEPAGAVAVAA
jgi:hypothetical protein